jgi:hypothetical protein
MRRALAIAAVLLAAALGGAAVAAAVDGSQAAYRAAAEPICKAEGEAKERIVGPRLLVLSAGRAETAVKARGRRLVRASRALGRSLAKLRAIPRPEVDAHRLGKWLDQVSEQVGRLRRAGKAAIAGERARAQKLVIQFTNGSRRANNLVLAYEFRHCVFEEAGFTP